MAPPLTPKTRLSAALQARSWNEAIVLVTNPSSQLKSESLEQALMHACNCGQTELITLLLSERFSMLLSQDFISKSLHAFLLSTNGEPEAIKIINLFCAMRAKNKPNSQAMHQVLKKALFYPAELLKITLDQPNTNLTQEAVSEELLKLLAHYNKKSTPILVELIKSFCGMQTKNKPNALAMHQALKEAILSSNAALTEFLLNQGQNNLSSEAISTEFKLLIEAEIWNKEFIQLFCTLPKKNQIRKELLSQAATLAPAKQAETLKTLFEGLSQETVQESQQTENPDTLAFLSVFDDEDDDSLDEDPDQLTYQPEDEEEDEDEIEEYKTDSTEPLNPTQEEPKTQIQTPNQRVQTTQETKDPVIPTPQLPQPNPSNPKKELPRSHFGINMMILGGFIKVLGLVAVALALTLLTAGTLVPAYFITIGLGVAALTGGLGIFSAGFLRMKQDKHTPPLEFEQELTMLG